MSRVFLEVEIVNHNLNGILGFCPVETPLDHSRSVVFVNVLSTGIYYFIIWSLALLEKLVDVRLLTTFCESENLFPSSQKLAFGLCPIASSLLLEICM
jgi:hypothetical protein